MSRLSQRLGITPKMIPIQQRAITEEVRNGLWSLFYDNYLNACRPVNPSHPQMSDIHTENSSLKGLIKELWFEYFKEPTDEIPKNYQKAIDDVKKRFFSGQWYTSYEIVEFVAAHGFKSQKQSFIDSVNVLLERENAAYRFVGETLRK